MGYTPDAFGRPVFDDNVALPADIQAAADFADRFAAVRPGTSAERAALTPGQLRPGLQFVETDTGATYRWTGSEWVYAVRGPLVLARTMGSSNTFQDRTSFYDFPVAADAAALTGRLVKASASTRLIVHAVASVQMTSGVPQNAFLGVSIGGTSYEVAMQNFGALNLRLPMHGIRQLSGIPAGDHEVKAQFRSAGGAIFLFFVGQDFVNLEIQEAT